VSLAVLKESNGHKDIFMDTHLPHPNQKLLITVLSSIVKLPIFAAYRPQVHAAMKKHFGFTSFFVTGKQTRVLTTDQAEFWYNFLLKLRPLVSENFKPNDPTFGQAYVAAEQEIWNNWSKKFTDEFQTELFPVHPALAALPRTQTRPSQYRRESSQPTNSKPEVLRGRRY
jgi:hypothetical protein